MHDVLQFLAQIMSPGKNELFTPSLHILEIFFLAVYFFHRKLLMNKCRLKQET